MKFKKNTSASVKNIVKPKSKTKLFQYNQKFIVISFCLIFVLVTSILLTQTPEVVHLAESKVAFLGNQPQINPKPLISEVAGAETNDPILEIISNNLAKPNFSAQAVLAEDFNTGQLLYQKNTNSRLSPASTTKIMTALVGLDFYRSADVLTVFPEDIVGGSSMKLVAGEKLTFRSLLYGMLLNSGNDAAFTIASNYPGGLSAFVEAMNKKAKELGLINTNFQNPAGFDAPNHYSSASDLAQIAKAAMSNSQLSKVVDTKETEVISWDKSHTHELKNLNQLLGQDGVIGVKTGFTEKSGENLVGLVEREGHKVLTVVLNSQDRFGESKNLMDWVYKNYQWKFSI